jgi:predicted DCC family thiol-disulfide oxidoreductase YuxK
VQKILRLDRKRRLLFAPLAGTTAERLPMALRQANSLVFLEEQERLSIRGRALARICWHLGGLWRLLGWLAYLPGVNGLYRLIAHHRHRLHPQTTHPIPPEERDRFLP